MQHTHDVRRRFLEYFRQQGHSLIASSPVVPLDDPSLLFTNAGMNQFKDVFLGQSVRDYKSATTSQKCIRVGGKHNDLENVGHTKRHLTFFEMLGNFSFGDYFKEKAIACAWEVATTIFKFDPKDLWISVFEKDDESYQIWTRYMPESRIVRIGEKDNFWAMGDTGPCGPCSELFFDRGPEFGSATNPANDTSGERFLEFWNLVFMQYNRLPNGTLEPLPKPSIDTGAGLERVMSLIQGKDSVYETDILRAIISSIEELCQIPYDLKDSRSSAFRVIADHLRCLCFAIADGVQPSNVERGYVLRKVLRRAVRYGKMLGFEKPFLAQLLPRFIEIMGKDYKELVIAQERIGDILTQEEEAFFRTLKRGGNMLNKIIESSKAHSNKISGIDAFTLKDTYGLPLEEVLLIAKDYDLEVDVKEFEVLEKEAKEKSRAAQKNTSQVVEENLYTDFVKKHGESFFERNSSTAISGKVLALVSNGQFVTSLEEGQEGMVILDKTNFYAEMGGQAGDSGELGSGINCFSVSDTISPFKGVIAHVGQQTRGEITLGNLVETHVDAERRQSIANNHTATHLLHWALHQVLGAHTKQAGSVVDQNRLRFDFSHHKAVSEEEIRALELIVNEKIRHNKPVSCYELPYEEAQKRDDILQFFGEKYGHIVRVVDIDFSKELCGGTHTSHTGNIGYFRITKESSIAAGVRRIEAVTGQAAVQFGYQSDETLKQLAELVKTPQPKLLERVEKLTEETKNLQQQLKQLQKERRLQIAETLPISITDSQIHYCIAEVPLPSGETRLLVDELSTRMPSAIIALGCKEADKAHIFVKISQDLVAKGFKASEFIKPALQLIEGSGGGKAETAQGAGKLPQKLSLAIQTLQTQAAK